MKYCHTQKAPLAYILLVVAALEVALAILFWDTPGVMLTLLGVGVAVGLAALSFAHLTIRDEGDCLGLRYGPLPLFRKRIPYAAMTAVESDQSTLIDGWGIHYVPWRGWIFNLWGFDCVKVSLGDKVIRIGSDDIVNLVGFVRDRIVAGPGTTHREKNHACPVDERDAKQYFGKRRFHLKESRSWKTRWGLNRRRVRKSTNSKRTYRPSLGGQVRELRVLVGNGGLILRGFAHTFHTKQLAQHAAMAASSRPILANEIEVS